MKKSPIRGCGEPGKNWPIYSLGRIRLNSQGYDASGAYWGIGAPLYRCIGEDYNRYFRAIDRESAKAFVRKDRPNARFYR